MDHLGPYLTYRSGSGLPTELCDFFILYKSNEKLMADG